MKWNFNTILAHWNLFWYRKAPPHALAIFRIAFGLYLIVEALTYLPFVPRLFSDQALTFSSWSVHAPSFIGALLEPPSPQIAWIIAAVYMIACIGLFLGFGMRLCLITIIVLFSYYWQLSFHFFPSSYHRIYLLALCALVFSGADKTFSLRMLRTHGSVYAWEPICMFAQQLLRVQIFITYLGVGLQKAWLPAWQDGAALSYSLISRWGTPLGFWVVGLNFPFGVYSAQVLGIKIMEVFLPFLLCIKGWRWAAVIAGACFHVGIAVLMSIWWFIPLIPAYILFWQPEEIHSYCKKWAKGRILPVGRSLTK
jgi:hypothetical protein